MSITEINNSQRKIKIMTTAECLAQLEKLNAGDRRNLYYDLHKVREGAFGKVYFLSRDIKGGLIEWIYNRSFEDLRMTCKYDDVNCVLYILCVYKRRYRDHLKCLQWEQNEAERCRSATMEYRRTQGARRRLLKVLNEKAKYMALSEEVK